MPVYTVDKWVYAKFIEEHEGHTQTKRAGTDGTVHVTCSCGDVLILDSDPEA
jgi:hypothetical protein